MNGYNGVINTFHCYIAMTTDAPCAVLALKHASVVYGSGVVGMQRSSVSFNAGEFVVLLGPSGAGKSTLLRALNGLVHQLIGRLTALDNVLTGRLGHHGSLRSLFPLPRHDRLLALDALDRVGLLDRALTRADQLSGGQQQRVGLARALAQQPRIILADEPVASLDPATARHALSLIHSVCKAQGIAAVVSLHQVDLALSFADRIIGVRAAQTVFDGPPRALDDATVQHIYTAAPRTQPHADSIALAA